MVDRSVLPSVPLPKDSVEIDGHNVDIRSLSRAQVLKLQTLFGDADAADNFIIACGTGVTPEEAKEWRESVDVATGAKLADAIIRLSGLAPEPEENNPN